MKSISKVRKTKDGATHIDAHVGSRLRLRRKLLGMNQKELAEKVNLTFQQIQKYESGANRIGSGRLYEFSLILGVSVGYFFDELPDAKSGSGTKGKGAARDAIGGNIPIEILESRETLNLIRYYYQVDDAAVRKRFLDLLRETSRAYGSKRK